MDQREDKGLSSSASQLALYEDEYLVTITGDPVPSFAELQKEFGEDQVSLIFDGRPFQNHDSCVHLEETPCVNFFWVAKPPLNIASNSEKIIAWGNKQRRVALNGYHVATKEEAYAFQKAHPEPQCHSWIVALGSSAMVGTKQHVVVLGSDSVGRFLADEEFGYEWPIGVKFLFVRNAQSN